MALTKLTSRKAHLFAVPAALCSLSLLSIACTASAAPVMKALKGANQLTTYAAAFPAPLVVWVADQATERPIPGMRVNFTAGPGIALSASFALTDDKGLASVIATGTAATTSQASAELAGIPGVQVSFPGLVVDKAPLTVVPADLDASMGGPIPQLVNYTIHGFLNGDTEATAHITGAPILSTTATDRSPHANYAIKGAPGTLSAPNYTFVAGFGTMAILGGPDSGKPDQSQGENLASATPDDSIDVRPAINTPEASQPAFLAGLHGQSGVFVRDAIWQAAPVTARALLSTSTRAVLSSATVITAAAAAPVHAAALPRPSAPTPSAQAASLHAASLPGPVTGTRSQPTVPVRVAMLAGKPTPAQPPLAQPEIRKALNPPGTR